MDIGFRVIGYVVVDYMTDALDIESTSRNVCRDQNVQRTILQSFDGLLAVILRHVAVHRGGGIASRLQSFGKFGRRRFGSNEHQNSVERFDFQNAGEGVELVYAADLPITLPDGFGGGRPRLDRYFLWIS